jgi:hypothetical protein
MTRLQRLRLAAAAAFVGGVALIIWVATRVLALGEPTWEGGRGGFAIYFALWLIFFSPAFVIGLLLERGLRASEAARAGFLGAVVLLTLGGVVVPWALDADLWLITFQTAGIGAALGILRIVVQRQARSAGREDTLPPTGR